jgi:very-short-patch-repair endonuclease
LRGARLDGCKFRRQVPPGDFVVDFICISAKLIVEVDGRQHVWEADYDVERSRVLEEMGFTVLRVTNEEVRDQLDRVLSRIRRELPPGQR